jgi:polar amino acid transport system permease protein
MSYVEFIRNVPLLLLVYFAFYGLPKIGITMFDNIWSFVVALSVYSGAYLTEVFRAGVNSVPVGYTEAAKAVGLMPWQRVRLIMLPVTFRIILPSLSNTFISLFKDTALASAIAVPELTYAAEWLNVNTFRTIEAWTFAAVMYLFAGYAIAFILRRIERRYAVIR